MVVKAAPHTKWSSQPFARSIIAYNELLFLSTIKDGEFFSQNSDEAVAYESSSPYLLSTNSIVDLLEKVKRIPVINENIL